MTLHVVFASFSRSAHSIGMRYFFLGIEVWRISLWAPNIDLKARSRENDKAHLCYDDLIFDDHEIEDYMACILFKMIIFKQFRHALTCHDPKTYLS